MKEKKTKDNKQLSTLETIKKSQEDSLIPKPVVVGSLRKENTSPFGILIFFAILIAVAFFLPKIANYFNGEEENVKKTTTISSSEEKDEDEIEDSSNYDEINYLEISSSDISINDSLIIKNMQIQNIEGVDYITFNIDNISNTTFSSKDNYFLELYDNNKSFIERIKVGKLNISSKKSLNKSLEISSNAKNNAKLFLFNSLNTKNYPKFELKYNNSIKATMTCTKNNDILSYNFTNDKLQSFKEEITVLNSEKNYDTLFKEYQDIYQKYVKIDDVEVNFVNNANDFTYNVKIDLNKVDYKKLNDERIYKLDTTVSVIKYEIESLQYKCTQGE